MAERQQDPAREQGGAANERLVTGKEVLDALSRRTTAAAASLQQAGVRPALAVLFRGQHADAASYRRVIKRHGERVGIEIREAALPEDAPVGVLRAALERLNGDSEVHGVLVQTPLPADQRQVVTEVLSYHKDVEGITPENLGRLVLNSPEVLPCTPAAVLALVEHRVPDLRGKRVVIINRSPTIGRPLSQIMIGKGATVTVCASATVDLPAEARRAEILVVAIGKPRRIGPDYIGDGALVIDVGINLDPSGSGLCGDVDTAAVLDRVSGITPVPGGVGPVTTAMLLANTAALAGLAHGLGLA